MEKDRQGRGGGREKEEEEKKKGLREVNRRTEDRAEEGRHKDEEKDRNEGKK